jgi:ABC-type multidrug transport system ATPase subunit
MTAVRLQGVWKAYGATQALAGLDLAVPRGSVCGLVGPNGAGKTTAFGVITGLLRADRGEIDLLGEGPFQPRRHAGRVSLLPQDSVLNPHLGVSQLLEYLGRLQGLPRAWARREVERVLDLLGLRERSSTRIRELSHGLRRRVAVAQALLGDPELVLLDEPTSGLDPELVVHLRQVFLKRAQRRTLVVSSHILSELEAVCDHVIFMQGGRAVQSGPVEEITSARRQIRIRIDGATPLDRLQALGLGATYRVENDALVITLPSDLAPEAANAKILPALLAAGVGVLEIRLGQSLEESYLAGRGQESPPVTD